MIRATLIGALLWFAFGIAYALRISLSQRRYRARMKRAGFAPNDDIVPGTSFYELCLLTVIWPVVGFFEFQEWLARRQ